MAISSVHGQGATWTGKKCGIDNQQLYDISSSCNDYCKSIGWQYGKCEINKGYGECLCGFVHPGK